MATIKDVAKMAGVSISTVSKYINGGNVREENIEAIRQAIEALDYRVNPFARSLKTQRSKSIGILLPEITAPFFGSVVASMDRTFREHGYHTLLSCYSSSHGLERDNLSYLISNGIDGLIYAPEDLSAEEYYELTANCSIPMVQFDRRIQGVVSDTVLVNNTDAVYDAVSQLIMQGHRRIAIITGLKSVFSAKERLVVIITHEYSEVADFVTRHIRLQDSLVCGDTVLREKAECPPTAVKVSHKQKLAPYVARIQLRSRPAWCGAVGLFFALTAFAIFVFLGSFIVALDDTPTRIFEPDAFRNGDMLRIAVVRKDGNNLTEEDYASVLDTEYVSHLERFGYIADLNYYYQEDKDFRYVYTNKNYGSKLDPVYMVDESIELLHSDNFLQTMPLTKDGSSIVTTGRDPENFYEIVVCGAPEWIGRTIPVYLRDVRKWAIGEYLVFDMTVVGVTDQGKGLYFHEDVGRMMTLQYFHGFCVFPQTEMVYTPVKYIDYVDCDTKKPFHTEIEWTEETVARPILDKEVTISFNRYKYLVEDRGNNYYDLYTEKLTGYEIAPTWSWSQAIIGAKIAE